jgi:hypothetical protein
VTDENAAVSSIAAKTQYAKIVGHHCAANRLDCCQLLVASCKLQIASTMFGAFAAAAAGSVQWHVAAAVTYSRNSGRS